MAEKPLKTVDDVVARLTENGTYLRYGARARVALCN